MTGRKGRGGEEIQKLEYLENEKSFLDEIKFFIVFEGPSVREKIIADTSFEKNLSRIFSLGGLLSLFFPRESLRVS